MHVWIWPPPRQLLISAVPVCSFIIVICLWIVIFIDFAPDNFFYSDDEYNDEYDGYNDDDYDDDDDDFLMSDSDEDFPIYRSRQHHAKYSDMMARRVSKATANSCKFVWVATKLT